MSPSFTSCLHFAHSPFSVCALCLQNQLRVSWRLPSIYSRRLCCVLPESTGCQFRDVAPTQHCFPCCEDAQCVFSFTRCTQECSLYLLFPCLQLRAQCCVPYSPLCSNVSMNLNASSLPCVLWPWHIEGVQTEICLCVSESSLCLGLGAWWSAEASLWDVCPNYLSSSLGT